MLLTTCRTLKKDCPFHITLSASKDGRHLVVSLMNTRHENHEVSEVDNVTVKPPLQAKTGATGDFLSPVTYRQVGSVESPVSQQGSTGFTAPQGPTSATGDVLCPVPSGQTGIVESPSSQQGSTGAKVPRGPTGSTGDILSLVSSGQVGTVESPGSQSSITIGDRFCSFVEVEARLAAFSKATFTQLWMRDARTISAAAKRTPNRAAVLNPDLKYYNVKYCCIHGGRTFQPEGQRHRQTL